MSLTGSHFEQRRPHAESPAAQVERIVRSKTFLVGDALLGLVAAFRGRA